MFYCFKYVCVSVDSLGVRANFMLAIPPGVPRHDSIFDILTSNVNKTPERFFEMWCQVVLREYQENFSDPRVIATIVKNGKDGLFSDALLC